MPKQVVAGRRQIMHSTFTTETGARETYLYAGTTRCNSFGEAMLELERTYLEACEEHGLNEGSLAFTRLFLSDIQNQKAAVLASGLVERIRCGAVLIIALVLVMFAWIGVNLFGVGLHSYGFTSSGAMLFIAVIGVETVFLITVFFGLRFSRASR